MSDDPCVNGITGCTEMARHFHFRVSDGERISYFDNERPPPIVDRETQQ